MGSIRACGNYLCNKFSRESDFDRNEIPKDEISLFLLCFRDYFVCKLQSITRGWPKRQGLRLRGLLSLKVVCLKVETSLVLYNINLVKIGNPASRRGN